MPDGPYLAIAYPLAHVGGGPMPPGGPTDPGYGQGHPIPPHIGGGPVYRPPHVSGGPVHPGAPVDPGYDQGHPLPPHIGGGPATPPGHVGGGPMPGGGVVMPPIHYPPTLWPPGSPPPVEGDFLVMVWVPNVGLTWVVVDKDLKPIMPLPEPPVHVGGGPAPTPEPKK